MGDVSQPAVLFRETCARCDDFSVIVDFVVGEVGHRNKILRVLTQKPGFPFVHKPSLVHISQGIGRVQVLLEIEVIRYSDVGATIAVLADTWSQQT